MKGARPLADEEVRDVADSFWGSYEPRNRALFLMGVRSGFRISELLSLEVRDVMRHGTLADRVTVRRTNMKKKTEGRTVPIHPEAAEALAVWIATLEEQVGVAPTTKLFLSQKGRRLGHNRSIGRIQAYRILQGAYDLNELQGQLGTHAMRKTFANRVHVLLGRDVVKTARALGHKNVNSTVSYLSFLEEEIDAAILAW